MARRPFPRGASAARGRRNAVRRTPQDNVRGVAAWVLERTLDSLAPVESFLIGARERSDERDHALLIDLVLGTLRWLRRLDQVIAIAANRKLRDIETPLRTALRIAAYQLLFLHHLPQPTVIGEAVEQAHCLTHRGGASFVNAVLRRLARDPCQDAWPVEEKDPARRLAIEMSHPDFLVQRWLDRLGVDRTAALLEANNRPQPLHLQGFRDRGGREVLAESLIDDGVDLEASALSPIGLKVRSGDPFASQAFRQGNFAVHDEAGQLGALVPMPRRGETILEAAAISGAENTLALLGCEPDLRCTLAEISPARAARIQASLRQLRRDLPLLVADCGHPAYRAAFDRVLLELPSSGTGALRERPELKWRMQDDDFGGLSEHMAQMLERAAPLVRPGGCLVAMTRSLEPEENENVVEGFLRNHTEFSPSHLEGLLPSVSNDAIASLGSWRLIPGDDHGGVTVNVLGRSTA